jgi:hypothetical protein
MLRIVGMANADMAICVHHLLSRQDAIGDDEVLNEGVEIAHGWLTRGDVLFGKDEDRLP